MEEEEENQTKVTEDIFKNITVGNLRDIKLKMPFNVQEAYRIPNIINQKKFPLSINNQTVNI